MSKKGTSGSEELRVRFSQPPTRDTDEKPHQTDIHVDSIDLECATGRRTPPRLIRFESHERLDSIAESVFGKGKTEPERFSFFPAKLGSSVPIANIGDLISPDGSLSGLFDTGPIEGAWWLDIVNPTEEEIDALANTFSIHPLTEQDIKMREARERIELFKHYYYVCFHSFYRTEAGNFRSFNVHVIVFREGTLTLTFSRKSQHTANVRKRMARLRDYVTYTSDWICYAIMDDIIDSFALLIDEIDKETNTIEDDVSVRAAGDSDPLLMQIHVCRQKVMSTMRFVNEKANIINSLTKSCGREGPATPRGSIKLYLGDIQDHVVTMISNLKHFDEMLLWSRSSYLAKISVERICAKHQIFQTISKCATIATILVSLYIICALFGMNVPVPGQATEGLGWWLGIAGVVVVGMLVSTILAKRKKLL
ncbi:hypothetical protein ABW20_dc0100693 [Dactylellina cionopaga]|nr:hypothetical protein ABW20_dc0100693 [Dactylellina cionopaga]